MNKTHVVVYFAALAAVCAVTYGVVNIIDSFEARHGRPIAVEIHCLEGIEYYVMRDGNIAPRFTDAGLVQCGSPVDASAAPVPQSYTY